MVPGRSETFLREPSWGPEGPEQVSRRANYQRGLVLRRSSYSRIQIFEDSVMQIFGIVFGGAAVRKNVLHADPVRRQIRKVALKDIG